VSSDEKMIMTPSPSEDIVPREDVVSLVMVENISTFENSILG
jgi:hypothetical protein